jgi:predicted ATPase/class 3 adenylate cyclase
VAMGDLPSGTVTLLFSDIEGSTLLLSRLGSAYADALDGQRRVLRKAWAEHGGTEMGTEGDSFFVVFPTAEGAVAAAAQAQQELTAFEWPGGEPVRVRMGIHTGSPQVHDGGYVGMDVHRAARIAGSAHGGQVVVSSVTAELVSGCLPTNVDLRDLGRHRLKDLPKAERLYQLKIDGLRTDFPPLKSLGAASSLPRPATPLVGRDGELAELAAVVSSSDVRLVTLTGPGGSGKTRLAVGVAQRLVERFPDGVFFVPLVTVTAADGMWSSVAEVVDVPPQERMPPGLFAHLAVRSAMFVLDNLEQLVGADEVVAELLNAAPQVVVIATSRRPLHIGGEHEHPVPPLELPERTDAATASTSGAVRMFVQHARMVRPSFCLTDDNAAAVVEVCRRLDGLPLALELAAARVKLLSPAALLGRLHTALDIAATGNSVPSRQKTLRATVGWSYELLTPEQQALFRRLGVFAGGADLDAIAAVAGDSEHSPDPFDTVAALVDASLVSVGEDLENEPRITMLETVRVYALDQLTASSEFDAVQARHARHYLSLAEELRPLMDGDRHIQARMRFESEHDNFRRALSWVLGPDDDGKSASRERVLTGLRLCAELVAFWETGRGSYLTEAVHWLDRALAWAAESDSPEVARCLAQESEILTMVGDIDRAHDCATRSVDMWRRLGGGGRLPFALLLLANIAAIRGEATVARPLFEEALTVARKLDNPTELGNVLVYFGGFESDVGNLQHGLLLLSEATEIAHDLGDVVREVSGRENVAQTVLRIGRAGDARKQFRDLIPQVLEINEAWLLGGLADHYAAALVETGEPHQAVRLLGAADAMNERGMTRDAVEQAESAKLMAKTRTALTAQEWRDAYQSGRGIPIEEALSQAHTADSPIYHQQ